MTRFYPSLMVFLSLDTDSVICQSSSMYLSKLLHVFVKKVAVVDRTRQQKNTLLSLDTDSVTTLAFMATSGGHQGGKRILFLGILAHMYVYLAYLFLQSEIIDIYQGHHELSPE